MDELLNHPAVQAAAAPFLAGLVTAGLLYRARLSGLAVVAGFAAAVALISGFNFTPLTATRKIVLLGLVAPVIGLALDWFAKPSRQLHAVLSLLAAAAAVWVFWAVLVQKDLADALRLGGIAAISTGATVALTLTLALESWKCGPHPASKKEMCGGNVHGSFKRSDFGMKFGLPLVGDEIKLWVEVEGYKD